jgi:phospholipase D1/2
MLKAAAERGVKVYVVVYKEVPQALTCKPFLEASFS